MAAATNSVRVSDTCMDFARNTTHIFQDGAYKSTPMYVVCTLQANVSVQHVHTHREAIPDSQNIEQKKNETVVLFQFLLL